jgi:hypothetical protein
MTQDEEPPLSAAMIALSYHQLKRSRSRTARVAQCADHILIGLDGRKPSILIELKLGF